MAQITKEEKNIRKELLSNGLKVCSCKKCKHNGCIQDVSNFWKNENRCKDCKRDRVKSWRKNNPVKQAVLGRRAKLKRKYNITPEYYDLMMINQRGRCQACGDLFIKGSPNYRPVIHHHHLTGDVVGLWHDKCNRVEGMIGTPDLAFKIYRAMESEALFYQFIKD